MSPAKPTQTVWHVRAAGRRKLTRHKGQPDYRRGHERTCAMICYSLQPTKYAFPARQTRTRVGCLQKP
ncbi:hypothetical protein ZHAS_00020344 [Anopheles sinensis]|uniref:Uncharacterized protein n=1 Tax=Anopheles sinensis TaxID=74873 RepID=A0A084WPT7_ANOSI|nr:hypothetical protein ZHAS_00020344 [Anopheles sinensis]